jgi:anti-sigma B factor antagonist
MEYSRCYPLFKAAISGGGGKTLELQFTSKQQAGIIAVHGDVDALTAQELTDFMIAKIEGGHSHLILDLSGVGFMSSSGLRALIEVLKKSRAGGGDLRLAATQPRIENVLKMAGFLNIIKSYPDVESALASFETGRVND